MCALPILVSDFPTTVEIAEPETGREVCYDELIHLIHRAAEGLRALHLPRLARVVIAEKSGLDTLVGLFACWQVGLVAVCVNPNLKPDEQSRVVRAVNAGAWLGQTELKFPKLAHGVDTAPLGPDDPALILMTSGTTGIPKGVTHSLHGLRSRASLNIAEIGRDTLCRTLCILPVFFGHGLIGNCLTPLLAGGRLILWPSPGFRVLGGFGAMLDQQAISFFSSVPTFWKMALQISPRPANVPARVHVGSAPLSIGLWQDIADWLGGGEVFNTYGMTETANWISGGALSDAQGQGGYVGRAWGGTLAVYANGRVKAEGRGEVLVNSPTIMQGYWQGADNPNAHFYGEWLRTGDIGEISQGQLTLVGRIKSEINRAGIKVLAEEIDMLLERHPDVSEACAFGIPDPVAGEQVAVAVVAGPNTAVSDLIAWCRTQCRAEAVPSMIFGMPSLPRNDRGKVVRSEIRALCIGLDDQDV
ncbi:acyl-CoA synthetase [Amylibacter marinus]|uniref:Acyl-CoA synthetase n=1 Tax=Amylibacter marinus TaxID=1475483 RepID=A0ABQ5VW87_9RHOB|nr:class I adenylate-forming enzyme family protein [Amylibacter marinus]GLQ35459.1 acyl-CoA synthetase [Amylibacter marinus]